MTRDSARFAGRQDSARPRHYALAYAAYCAAVIVFAIWIGWQSSLASASSPLEWTKAGWTPPLAAQTTLLLCVVAMCGIPFYPPTGLMVYLVAMYGFARYAPELEFVYVTRLPEVILGMTLAGWCLWNVKHGWIRPLPRGVAPAALAALVIWELLAACVAATTSNYWPPHLSHEPTRLVEAGIAFLVAATFLSRRWSILSIVMLLTVSLVVREFIWRRLTYLDGDISALLSMTIPLVLGTASIAKRLPFKLALLGIALYLTWLLCTAQNRAAGLGLIAAIVTIWLNSPRRLVSLGVAMALIVMAVPFVRETNYWNRYAAQIYRDGKFVGSAESRLQLWEATWQVIQQQPLFGTGPGSVSRVIGDDPRIGHYVTHNSYLELLAETGVPGLMLYLVFFTAILFAAWRLQRAAENDWPSWLAKYLMASLAAYLTFGMFISRQDLVLAYIVAGIVVALTLRESHSESRTVPAV